MRADTVVSSRLPGTAAYAAKNRRSETVNTFHSTRNSAPEVQAKQAIRQGLAPDGGLFVSDDLGTAAQTSAGRLDLSALSGRSYRQIAVDVLALLLPDFSEAELDACIHVAYADQWSDPAITPLRELGDDYVLELFHGPTSAFKDVALQILPHFMRHTEPASIPSTAGHAGSDGQRILILTATSGDTGKAALAGFADVPGTGIVVFYPHGEVSEVQALQMTTQLGSNVHVVAVNGNFDDAQAAVKALFSDSDLTSSLARHHDVTLSSANSINVGRLVPQVVYYVVAYARLLERGRIRQGDGVEFVVPTGNFGDVLAGYYAKLLGLPVSRLTVASDANNVLFDFLTTGVYNRNRPFFRTISPSMDILISSNLERMLYYMSAGDTALIRSFMHDLATGGEYRIPADLLARITTTFGCGWADEDHVRAGIRDCWQRNHYVIDPHTACGYAVMQGRQRDPNVPRVLLSTASPYKFPRVVNESLGLDTPASDFACMDVLARHTGTTPPAALRSLDHADIRFRDVIDIQQMRDVVEAAAADL